MDNAICCHVDAKIRASDKDLPVFETHTIIYIYLNSNFSWWNNNSAIARFDRGIYGTQGLHAILAGKLELLLKTFWLYFLLKIWQQK